jgi:hypothetical protein
MSHKQTTAASVRRKEYFSRKLELLLDYYTLLSATSSVLTAVSKAAVADRDHRMQIAAAKGIPEHLSVCIRPGGAPPAEFQQEFLESLCWTCTRIDKQERAAFAADTCRRNIRSAIGLISPPIQDTRVRQRPFSVTTGATTGPGDDTQETQHQQASSAFQISHFNTYGPPQDQETSV